MNKEELIIGFFEKGYCCNLDEVKNTCLGLLKENQKYKEVIDKAKEWIYIVQNDKDNKHLEPFISTDELDELLDILKEVE